MDAITRYSATDPVRFDIMNKSFDEIEKRDEELEEQINNLSTRGKIPSNNEFDKRHTNTLPSDYISGLYTNQLKDTKAVGLPTDVYGSYVHLIGLNNWTDTSATVTEFGFTSLGKMVSRTSLNNSTWGEWRELATTEAKPFIFANGWKSANQYDAYFIEATKTGSIVTLNVLTTNDAQASASQVIGVTPFLPAKYAIGSAVDSNGNVYRFEVRPDGTVYVHHAVSTHYWIAFNISYRAK